MACGEIGKYEEPEDRLSDELRQLYRATLFAINLELKARRTAFLVPKHDLYSGKVDSHSTRLNRKMVRDSDPGTVATWVDPNVKKKR
jgi:hypothetical protein